MERTVRVSSVVATVLLSSCGGLVAPSATQDDEGGRRSTLPTDGTASPGPAGSGGAGGSACEPGKDRRLNSFDPVHPRCASLSIDGSACDLPLDGVDIVRDSDGWRLSVAFHCAGFHDFVLHGGPDVSYPVRCGFGTDRPCPGPDVEASLSPGTWSSWEDYSSLSIEAGPSFAANGDLTVHVIRAGARLTEFTGPNGPAHSIELTLAF